MAMSANDAKTPARRSATAKSVVPPSSREATARKLEAPAEIDELSFDEVETPLPTRRTSKVDSAQEARQQERQSQIIRLSEKRETLVERLDVGAARIEEARTQGKDVTSWEDYWISLLRQYESLCDKLRDLHNEF